MPLVERCGAQSDVEKSGEVDEMESWKGGAVRLVGFSGGGNGGGGECGGRTR